MFKFCLWSSLSKFGQWELGNCNHICLVDCRNNSSQSLGIILSQKKKKRRIPTNLCVKWPRQHSIPRSVKMRILTAMHSDKLDLKQLFSNAFSLSLKCLWKSSQACHGAIKKKALSLWRVFDFFLNSLVQSDNSVHSFIYLVLEKCHQIQRYCMDLRCCVLHHQSYSSTALGLEHPYDRLFNCSVTEMRQAQGMVSEAIIQQIVYYFTFQHFHMWFVSLPTYVGGYPWGHSTVHARNVHNRGLRGLGRECYCALSIKRRNGNPARWFCSIHCDSVTLFFVWECLSCAYMFILFRCQLIKLSVGPWHLQVI